MTIVGFLFLNSVHSTNKYLGNQEKLNLLKIIGLVGSSGSLSGYPLYKINSSFHILK